MLFDFFEDIGESSCLQIQDSLSLKCYCHKGRGPIDCGSDGDYPVANERKQDHHWASEITDQGKPYDFQNCFAKSGLESFI